VAADGLIDRKVPQPLRWGMTPTGAVCRGVAVLRLGAADSQPLRYRFHSGAARSRHVAAVYDPYAEFDHLKGWLTDDPEPPDAMRDDDDDHPSLTAADRNARFHCQ
jgi:hypothetical protein